MVLNKNVEPFFKNQAVSYFQEELKFMWTQKEVLITLGIEKLFFTTKLNLLLLLLSRFSRVRLCATP